MEKNGKAEDQIAMPSQIKQHDVPKRESETNDITDRNQEARFGFTNIGSTGSVSIKTGFFSRVFCNKYLRSTYTTDFFLLAFIEFLTDKIQLYVFDYKNKLIKNFFVV